MNQDRTYFILAGTKVFSDAHFSARLPAVLPPNCRKSKKTPHHPYGMTRRIKIKSHQKKKRISRFQYPGPTGHYRLKAICSAQREYGLVKVGNQLILDFEINREVISYIKLGTSTKVTAHTAGMLIKGFPVRISQSGQRIKLYVVAYGEEIMEREVKIPHTQVVALEVIIAGHLTTEGIRKIIHEKCAQTGIVNFSSIIQMYTQCFFAFLGISSHCESKQAQYSHH